MMLPMQAPALLRGSPYGPSRAGVAAAQKGGVVQCTDPTPYACICDNGIATCCGTNLGCTVDSGTGACQCSAKG